jgi:ATP-dependent Clp protease ATP-binding subunit ClpA
MAIKGDDLESLATLEERIKSQIFGQDEAIQKLVESVQMSKSGLTDDGKPVASMLFVGPTGVGKTEVAKVLAKELGVELIRFDMSEYTEKHTVAKLIGSPAGYIGYDDGGLLTDAIRKTPYCVLLLDEIEKAHSDIYNILLQVMDYAQLTDNKGNKADFKNVILLMTSNAGAQHARKANIGFGGGTSTGEAMMKQVKQTFKPEFINRLSATVVFHDMDKEMARLILDKKLKGFREKLEAKKVTLNLSAEAYEWLLEKGFTPEYGAREMDRVVAQYLKPLLMRSILFGKMKKGGEAVVSVKDGELWMK